MNETPKVYLAGFDVFRADAEALFADLRAEAARLGLDALVPTDNGLEIGPDDPPSLLACKIREANLVLLRQADAVVANLAPFRGLEPDSGTVYEVGFAQALGLPVCGYGMARQPYVERVAAAYDCRRDAAGALREVATGWLVEDFGLPLNLMLACGVDTADDAHAALAAVARRLRD